MTSAGPVGCGSEIGRGIESDDAAGRVLMHHQHLAAADRGAVGDRGGRRGEGATDGGEWRRTGQPYDERTPSHHSITSSARTRIDGGIARPSACAVRTFNASSNFVGCSTGRSPGLAPLRSLTTIAAVCRNIAARFGPKATSPPASTCSFHW